MLQFLKNHRQPLITTYRSVGIFLTPNRVFHSPEFYDLDPKHKLGPSFGKLTFFHNLHKIIP